MKQEQLIERHESLGEPDVDSQGRTNVTLMSDRYLLEECVRNQREMLDTVKSFVDALKANPMFGMMAKKFGA